MVRSYLFLGEDLEGYHVLAKLAVYLGKLQLEKSSPQGVLETTRMLKLKNHLSACFYSLCASFSNVYRPQNLILKPEKAGETH